MNTKREEIKRLLVGQFKKYKNDRVVMFVWDENQIARIVDMIIDVAKKEIKNEMFPLLSEKSIEEDK